LIATQGHLFSYIGDARSYCSSMSSPSTPLALSPQKATTVLTTTLALSPQKVTRSIFLLRCPRQPVLFASASCARSEDHAYFLSSESRRCSRPAGRMRDGERGQRTSTATSCKVDALVSPSPGPRRRPLHYRRGRDATSDPPHWPRLPRRKSSSMWKLIAPFIEILQLS
jgi:hypothetical protein